MERKSFLKSLLVAMAAPKVVMDALKEDEYQRDYGEILRLDSYPGFILRINEPPPGWAKKFACYRTPDFRETIIDISALKNIQQ